MSDMNLRRQGDKLKINFSPQLHFSQETRKIIGALEMKVWYLKFAHCLGITFRCFI